MPPFQAARTVKNIEARRKSEIILVPTTKVWMSTIRYLNKYSFMRNVTFLLYFLSVLRRSQ